MIKILLLATRPQAIEKVKKLLPPGVQLRTALLSSGDTIKFETAFTPDVMIVHVENVNRQRLFGIMDLRENDAYKYLPLLLIGDEKNYEVFEQNVHPGSDRSIDSEADEEDIKNAILGIIDLRQVEEKHILVIDDDPVLLRSMRSYLEEDYMVTVVRSGKMALKFMEKQTPDLIFLDYMMPEWDGASTFQLIRSTPNGKKIPIVFLTGVADKDKVMECLALKPQGYLVKPVTKAAVLTKLKEIV